MFAHANSIYAVGVRYALWALLHEFKSGGRSMTARYEFYNDNCRGEHCSPAKFYIQRIHGVGECIEKTPTGEVFPVGASI